MQELYLIDGTAILYRSYFAFIKNPLRRADGFNTSAIFGTVNTFFKMLENNRNIAVAISFDRKEKTFRHELDQQYKANRPEMPDDLVPQIEPVKQFFNLLQIPVVDCAGYEADDVLATLGTNFAPDYKIVYITSDKDYVQLLDAPNAVIYDPFKDVVLDAEAATQKYQLTPQQFIDYLALTGDASDNVPGVKGIGPKTAAKLLSQYNTLDGIYQHLTEIKGSAGKKLADDQESAYLSQKLVTIIRDVPTDMPAKEQLFFDYERLEAATEFLQEYNLSSMVAKAKRLLSANQATVNTQDEPKAKVEQKTKPAKTNEPDSFDFFNDSPANTAPPAANQAVGFTAVCADTLQAWESALHSLSSTTLIALDTETTSVDQHQADLVGVSVSAGNGRAYYAPVGHVLGTNLPLSLVLDGLAKLLPGKTVAGHNIKFDLTVLERAGLKLEAKLFDTMLASYVLEPGNMRHGLDACALKEFGHNMIPIKNLIGTGKKQVSFAETDIDSASVYAAEDAYYTYKLAELYIKRLDESDLADVFNKLEMPLLPVLKRMEQKGVYLDTDYLHELDQQLKQRLGVITNQIFELAETQFNINSTQQLAQILFENLSLPSKKKTKTGYSTDSTVLEELVDAHPIIPLLLEYRLLNKLDSTYVSALPKLVNPLTNRVHSSFNQSVASTGRLSSSNPNLQNIPMRTPLGRSIRKAFVAGNPGWKILAADYSQIELRLLALFSKDPVLIEAFAKGLDIHASTAALIFDTTADKVTKEMRARAKTINFGIIYGMGAQRLSKELGIKVAEAKEFIDNYFAKFPSIRAWMDDQVAFAQTNHWCQTIFGRRLYLPNIVSTNNRLQSEASRVAVNMPIQGSAADIIKLAMIAIDKELKDRTDVSMLIQVHDELVFEVAPTAIDEITKLVVDKMQNALPNASQQPVKLLVEPGVGDNWLDAH